MQLLSDWLDRRLTIGVFTLRAIRAMGHESRYPPPASLPPPADGVFSRDLQPSAEVDTPKSKTMLFVAVGVGVAVAAGVGIWLAVS